RNQLSAPNYRDWTQAATVFERTGMWRGAVATLVGAGDPVRVEGASLSFDVLPTLGVSPVMGRAFIASDDTDGAPGTMLLSYALWQTQFRGDPNVLGRKVLLSDEPSTLIAGIARHSRKPAPAS